MRRRFQFSLETFLVAVCLTGPAVLALPRLADSLSGLSARQMWATIGHPNVAGFTLMVVILCGMILLRATDKKREL